MNLEAIVHVDWTPMRDRITIEIIKYNPLIKNI